MLSVKYVFLIWQETNGGIVILKTVLKSDLWPGSEKCGLNPKLEDNDLKSGCYRVPKLPPLSVNYVCPISQEDESSNHDSENCSEISAVTQFRICPELLHFLSFRFFTPPYWTFYWCRNHIFKNRSVFETLPQTCCLGILGFGIFRSFHPIWYFLSVLVRS